MKRILSLITAALVLTLLPGAAWAADRLVPGGQVIGLQLENDTVIVAAFDEALGDCAKASGIKIGDQILCVDGKTVRSAEDVRTALDGASAVVRLTLRRGTKTLSMDVQPRQTADGARLGVFLKQGISGIGTVTWYDPENGMFGTLGHGVNDGRGTLAAMVRGTAFSAQVVSVKKGVCGEPGQLKGSAEAYTPCGKLLRNTSQGVFGKLEQPCPGSAIPVAEYEEISKGTAVIRSTVNGTAVREYSVEILKIYPEDRSDGRNFLLRVTDPELLSATGGIVQGMSGSPILQNGKLVGAVTHVLVNDPTAGYGIYIENMLDAAS